jgi:EAL domain-containing protein (putative c-di-GMP-specific phosphodiesterase class I)
MKFGNIPENETFRMPNPMRAPATPTFPPGALPIRSRLPRRAAAMLRRDLEGLAGGQGLDLRYQLRHALATGAPTCAEATILWPQRHRGRRAAVWELPAESRVALDAGAAGWALHTACAAASRWPGIAVSVALNRSQFAGHAIVAQLVGALERSGLDPECLELAMDEATAASIGPDEMLTLAAIRDLGIGLAIADFGADSASLAVLRRLPLTAVKLAGAMLRDIGEDPEAAAIAAAIVAAAHGIGLCVVAGGLTDEAQRACLAACGCDEAQGALFGSSLPAAEITITF